MTREKLTKVFNSNAFYIAFSIIAAILLWTYIAFIHNDTMTVSIKNAPVVVEGVDEIADRGLIATSFSRDKINLTVSGGNNIVSRISASDVYVTIDLIDIISNGASVGVYQLPYTVHYPNNVNSAYVNIDSASADYITVQIENLITKDIPVRAAYDAVIPDGYQAQPIELGTESISISGPETIVNSISSALVNVAEIELTDTFSEDLPFVYLNNNDEEVTSDLVTANTSTVYVVIPVVMIKEVSLDVEFTGKNSADDNNTSYSITPSRIEISGSPSKIKNIEKISVASIDLTDFESELNQIIDIKLPDGITNVSGTANADVFVRVSGLDTKEVTVTDFSAFNVTQGHSAEVVTKSLDVTIRGKSELIDDITSSDVVVKADLTSLRNATGTYSVPAVITVGSGQGIDAIGNYTLTVTITKD